MAKKPRFYVVWRGRENGVFESWEQCAQQVHCFPNAEYKAFPSREAAEKALKDGYAPSIPSEPTPDTPSEATPVDEPNLESYSVDASCIGYPGPVEYRCVHTQTKDVIFKQGPFPDGGANLGEFLAVVHALALFKKKGITLPIYTDSITALSWVRKKKCKSKIERREGNKQLFNLVDRAEIWLQTNNYPNAILKWETVAWGEIPADFGRK